MQGPRTTFPPLAPAAPSHLAGTGTGIGTQLIIPIPIPGGTSWWEAGGGGYRLRGGCQGFPRTVSPVRPSTSCSRTPIPPGSPGRTPNFLAPGQAASPPQLRAGRRGLWANNSPSTCFFL